VFHVKQSDWQLPLPIERRLRGFAELLWRWNGRINLVGQTDPATLWTRHILDSAQLAPLLPTTPDVLVDFGSGAGFPGLVLAIVAGWRAHLIEADARKAAFLREAARLTAADVVVHVARAEDAAVRQAPVVTARALAPLPRLLALAAPALAPQGLCLFPKGRRVLDELTAARREWHMEVEQFPSRTDPAATLLRIREIRPVTRSP
jgi:16S rRNA (guanine(527)-N(7))-methyltransferase RsmG